MTSAYVLGMNANTDTDAKAKAILEASGRHHPLYVSAGEACMVAEFATESEARACAKEFGKLTTTAVDWDCDLGWTCTIDIPKRK